MKIVLRRFPLTETATTETSNDHSEDHVSTLGVSNDKLGMWVFLGSDCLLFGGLISTYMLYKDLSLIHI